MIKNPYHDRQRQIAFENAIDCWYYGMSKSYCDFQGLDGQSADEVCRQLLKLWQAWTFDREGSGRE